MIDRETMTQLALDSGAAKFYPERQSKEAFVDKEKLIPQNYLVGHGFLERFAAAVAQIALTEAIQRLNQNAYSLTKTECIEEIRAIRARSTGGAG